MAIDVGTKKQGECPPPPPPKAVIPHPTPERPFPLPPPPPPFMPGPCCPPTNTLVLNNTIIKSVDNALKITEGYVHGSPAYFIEFDKDLIKPNIVGEDPIVVKEGVFTEDDGTEKEGFLVTIKDMSGASADKDGTSGSVPAPKTGDQDKYLSGDGSWKAINGITDPTEDNVILGGSADGTKSWLPISTEQFGDDITDENFATLITKVNNVGIGAERARADADGNDIIVTYATKNDLTRLQPIFYDAGSLADSSTVNVNNNATQRLSSSQSTLTLNVNLYSGEVPYFVVEINATTAITLAVTKTVGSSVTTLYPSEAGGTSLESGKFYQISCVGNCWTLAEFVQPSS